MKQTTLTQSEHLVVLSAGPIPYNSIHLLIITTDFVALTDLLDMSFSLCSTLKFYSVFLGS